MNETLYFFEVLGNKEDVEFASELLTSLELDYCAETDMETGKTAYTFYSETEKEAEHLHSTVFNAIKSWQDLNLKLELKSINTLKKEDWTEVWKRYFKIQHISDKLVIKASWLDYKPTKGQVVIEIDPGMSFGTGSHETTQFCLQMIENLSSTKNKSFLDAGCGSGILTIAAAKFGYNPIYAFDFDKESISASKENLGRNNLTDKNTFIEYADIKLYHPNRTFDIVNANIISSVLVENRDRLVSWIKPGGYLILAGIMRTEYEKIKNYFLENNNLSEVKNGTEKDWTGGLFVRN